MRKILLFLGLATALACLAAPPAYATTCAPAIIVFARGSGQTLSHTDTGRFFSQIRQRISSDIALAEYELGRQAQGGHQYPAVAILDDWQTPIGASMTGGQGFTYGRSVDEGAHELSVLLQGVINECRDIRIILAGYSQGAQVVGQILPSLPKEIRDQIDFVALFGDPKLNLPEGRGFNPPACRGENYSAWRRVVPDCDTDNGTLGAREPYLPEDMRGKTGLWCNDDDFVCGSSSFLWVNGGHSTYASIDGAIDKAAQEIAERLSRTVVVHVPDPPPPPPYVPQPPAPPAFDLKFNTGETAGADVMIVLDVSWYMGPVRGDMLRLLHPLVNHVTSSGGRAGVLLSCDCEWAGMNYLYSPLDTDPLPTIWRIGSIELEVPPLDASARLLTSISTARENSSWRHGVKHIIIPFTNIPYSQGLMGITTSSYSASLASTSPTNDQVHIYPLVSPDFMDSYAALSNDTTIVHTLNHPNTVLLTEEIMRQIDAEVTAMLPLTRYKAAPGMSLTFDASGSKSIGDTIDHYEWDFDGNGSIDRTTQAASTHYTYTVPFNGSMEVTAVTQNGFKDTTSASVLITTEGPPASLAAPTKLAIKMLSDSSAELSWNTSEPLAAGWILRLNSIPLGRLDEERRSVVIDDLERDSSITFSLQTYNNEGRIGEMAEIRLDPNETEKTLDTTAQSNDSSASSQNTSDQVSEGETHPKDQAATTNNASQNEPRKQNGPQLLPFILLCCGVALILGLGCWALYRWVQRNTE